MRNAIVQDRILRERARFVESIDQAAILSLASASHHDTPCRFFRPLKHGGFNVCFFVEFDHADPDAEKIRWVIRIPIPGRTPVNWIDEKLEVEVATMKHVALNTTIPVPKVHAYSFTSTSPIGMAFIIMDFVDGQNLMEHGFKDGEKWNHWAGPTEASKRVHRQLAELFFELRKQEFPRIGALGFDAGGPTQANPAAVRVCHRPLSIEIVMQECEGQIPGERFPANKTFETASEYIQSLLWLLDNELNRSTNPDIDVDNGGGGLLLYAAQDFPRFVTEKWLDASKEEGPFVLMHGDLHNHYSNMLWDQDLNLVGVIDWEWSRVVPLQLLTPPVWLQNTTVDSLTINPWSFRDEVGYLLEAVRVVEDAQGGPHTLSKEWAKMETWWHPLVVSALFRPNDVYEVYWGPICKERFEVSHLQTRPEVMVEAVSAWQKSENIQAWLKEKRAVQDKYYEEEDAYVFWDEEDKKPTEASEAS